MNYSEELSKIVDKKNCTAVNAVILHLRHNSLHFKVRYCSFTLHMAYSEMLVNVRQTTGCHKIEDRELCIKGHI